MMQLRQLQPENKQIAALWKEMLQSEELSRVATDPSFSIIKLRAAAETSQR
ncbi:MAG: hypothetical protein WCA35_24740 [Kovacikia sp.]